MNKYKINIDRDIISSESIAQERNFAAVQTEARIKDPLYTKTKIFLNSVAILITVAVVGYLLYSPTNQDIDDVTSFIVPPINDINISFQEFQLEACIADTIISERGSRVIIPANAFADTTNQIAKGAIIFKVREFHNQADIFLSGIPMGYDSLANNYTLESAGMIELRAFQNGKELQLVPEKELEVELVSDYSDNDYNVYYLDENLENWQYVGKDSLILPNKTLPVDEPLEVAINNKDILELQRRLDSIITNNQQFRLTEPIKPQKALADKWKIELDVIAEDFPELSVYEGTNWQFADDALVPDIQDADITWDDIIISKAGGSNNYLLTVKKGSKEKQYTVNPVYTGIAYADAINNYENKFNTYKAARASRRQEEANLLAAIEADKEKWRLSQQRAMSLRTNINNNKGKLDRDIFRRFSVSTLGVWNCDRIINTNRVKTVNALCADKNGDAMVFKSLYVINKNRNTVLQSTSQVSIDDVLYYRVMLNKLGGDIIIGINIEDKIIVLSERELNYAVKSAKEEVVFNFSVIDKEVSSKMDFKKLYENSFNAN
ncbi:hypothetical protein [Saccharicrinis aurantiacus]|uniref:hypothetical protein n=1 Tax=Saccharicrinis aurantiacus TaxID=1849719 RepID=UPI00094FD099|nr:hypothetical protein [Saccharicrinis aurantiacus]